MRNTIILLSAAALLVACADDGDTTAPRSTTSSAPAATSNITPPSPSAPVQDIKSGSEKFSIVFTVSPPWFHAIRGAGSAFGEAVCPAGSHVIGGFITDFGYGTLETENFHIENSTMDEAGNGWKVSAYLSTLSPHLSNSFSVTAICIQ